MMNLLRIMRNSIVVLYLLINIFLLAINWGGFTISQEINVGFGVITAAPAVVVMIMGFLMIGLILLTLNSTEQSMGLEGQNNKEEVITKHPRIELMKKSLNKKEDIINKLKKQLVKYRYQKNTILNFPRQHRMSMD